ncbi:MAG: 4Fe-4S dicluster domain-containing protein [Candidatus Marinimicrobia bacterium]|nr:4Fe-4S dicluster domain-containing protein [Candidatus Neomarinimicrobiota bacterium]
MIKKIKITSHNQTFYEKVKTISGEDIAVCDRCGVCTGSCPLTIEMEISPSNIMKMVQLGQEDVMDYNSMWVCSTCNYCTARCPRGLDVSKVTEALRQIRLRTSFDKIQIDKIPKEELKDLPQIALVGAFRRLTS